MTWKAHTDGAGYPMLAAYADTADEAIELLRRAWNGMRHTHKSPLPPFSVLESDGDVGWSEVYVSGVNETRIIPFPVVLEGAPL